MTYTISVVEKSGIVETTFRAGYRSGIDAWMRDWSHPERLCATVRDSEDVAVGLKPFGRKRIVWVRTPQSERNGKKTTIYMSHADIELAKARGAGKIGLGIHLALAHPN